MLKKLSKKQQLTTGKNQLQQIVHLYQQNRTFTSL